MKEQARTPLLGTPGQELEIVTDVGSHVTFLREVVCRHFPSTDCALTYTARLLEIERRAIDPRLYLAVIGEFSSGKSTFINALLRRRLLKASCAATTASVTKVVPGACLRVTATFNDGTTITATETELEELRTHILGIHPAGGTSSLEQLLELLTSESSVANHVRDVEVEVPGRRLDERIVILDTPGIGAGAETASAHAALTASVMSTLADGAVVLIPSAAPMSRTLVKFLDTHAKPFLHRCVFVITGADRHTPDERDRVLYFVRQQLRASLDLDEPLILQAAAIAMVPIRDLPAAVEAGWAEWRPKFVRLEADLTNALQRQRMIIIAERLARLLESAVEDIAHDLDSRRMTLDDEKARLDEHTVTAIDVVLETLERMAQKKVEAAASAIKSSVASRKEVYRVATQEFVEAALRAQAWDADSYEAAVAPRVRTVIDHYGREYTAEADREVTKLRRAATKVASDFAKQFEENYSTLRALELTISVPAIVVPELSVPPVAFRESRPYIERQQASKRTGRNVGMGLGAAIGFVLAGPPGAVVGGVIGRGGGGVAAGDDVTALQSRLRSLLASDIAAYLDGYESAICARVDRIAAHVLKQFRDASQRHRNEYSEVVADLVRQHQRQRKALAQEIRIARSDAEELAHRAERLKTVRQRLATEGRFYARQD